jgi:protease I
MTKKILMIIALKNFQDNELMKPKEVFEQKGYSVVIASTDTSTAKGMLGGKVEVDLNYFDTVVDDYEAVIFVGGSGASIYFDDEQAIELARSAYQGEKVVGAICIAPSILANSGILKGKLATSYASEADNLEEKGAKFTGDAVTVDGKVVTADGPNAAKEFGEKIVELLND